MILVRGAVVVVVAGFCSTWFSVGVLSLQPPAPNPAITAGTKIVLAGVARGLHGVVVQARSSGAPWRQLRSIVPDATTGAFHFAVKPKVTTQYRLATAQDAAAAVRIRVKAATLK